AKRMQSIESSGIRKVFELARSIPDPINLSIGQPHHDVAEPIKQATIRAIEQGHNAYTITQGIPALRERLLQKLRRDYPDQERDLMIASGTAGGLVLALLACINPGDEVILFDPYFVMYPHLTRLAGGVPVLIDTYPDFSIDVDAVQDALTPRTRAVIVNSPSNPTGRVCTEQELRDLAQWCAQRELLLISDEIYAPFVYDRPFVSPAKFNPLTLVVDSFSKSHSMTGWRVGVVHGPPEIIRQMITLQQYTFVCAPSMAQWGALAACDYDPAEYVRDYKTKRDFMVRELSPYYELGDPSGAFYLFPRAPGGSGQAFVEKAIANRLLVIPGNVFSLQDSHFRLSYAASDETLARGVEILKRLAQTDGV
ncbi:MAG: aminotransferase class I/II-fold pyridoxal phosphate-dependent enzyme, partial [Gemmataceae bacterium]